MGDRGVELQVLPQYLVEEKREKPDENVAENESKENNGGSKKKWKKSRGRNKDRPGPIKFSRAEKLCPVLSDLAPGSVSECSFPGCAFRHDVAAFLADKPADIAPECHIFTTFDYCRCGLSCRFASGHIVDGKFNADNRSPSETSLAEANHLGKNLKENLRKKRYDFAQTDAIVEENFVLREQRLAAIAGDDPESKKPKLDDNNDGSETKEPRVPKKTIEWRDKLLLAPLTTVGNLPFRRICKKFGADITCGEMAMSAQLLQGHQPEWALVQRHSSEDVFGIQLCGSSPQQVARVGQLVEDGHIDADFVDINLGCPIDLVYKRGMGSGMMVRKKPLEVMVRSMAAILSRPVTVKIRTGVFADKRLAHDLAPCLRDWGASLVTLHGRSREQRYTRLADWDYIGDVVRASSPMPIIGNGDIINYEDYEACRARSGAAGVMVARGALIKPWVFREIKDQRHWDISAGERLEIVRDFANYGLEHWGSDDKGVETTRRFLLEWLSFAHRYVPVGLLVKPPQRINERAPKFAGRQDLETLLGSAHADDWIKITEMYLGKVPENFAFQPKHKANAYK